MIEITSKPIGEGYSRLLYMHPQDENKAIKVSKNGVMDAQSKRESKCYKQLMKRKILRRFARAEQALRERYGE